MPAMDNYADIFVNAERKVMPQALSTAFSLSKKKAMSPEEASKAAADFESMFLAQMMQELVPEEADQSSLFGQQEGDEIFRGMMMEEYAKQVAKSGGIGLASYIERELLGTGTAPKEVKNYTLPIGHYEKTQHNNQQETQPQGESL